MSLISKLISLTGADFVDINSGVEEQPGEKVFFDRWYYFINL